MHMPRFLTAFASFLREHANHLRTDLEGAAKHAEAFAAEVEKLAPIAALIPGVAPVAAVVMGAAKAVDAVAQKTETAFAPPPMAACPRCGLTFTPPGQ